ncbi:MAG: diguanylate cyclase [Bacillaceae bacterium]|nr:diguanylate cyclase [Bacillaceae bacterium]
MEKLKAKYAHVDFALYLINDEKKIFFPAFSTNATFVKQKVSYSIREEEVITDFNCPPHVISSQQGNYHIPQVLRSLNHVTLIPVKTDEQMLGFLLCVGRLHDSDVAIIKACVSETSKLINRLLINENLNKERKRKELLLKVTKKFHSSMNVSDILEEIILALKGIYPSYETYLLLSHEWEVDKTLPVKQLEYRDVKNSAMKTYLNGETVVEDLTDYSVLYAPLRGKQGVYGVLEIKTCHSMHFYHNEIDFIEVLAHTGGNAIENAELYQQSRQLVEDLQLINKTTHQLNLNLKIAEVTHFIVKQIKESTFAQEVGFFHYSSGKVQVLDGSTSYFINNNQKEFAPIFKMLKKEKESVYVGDLTETNQYKLGRFKSFIAVPMVQSDELIGAVIIVHKDSYHFTFQQFKLLQSLIHHSTLAFSNSILHEELERLVITDHLTKLYARSFLDDHVQQAMEYERQGSFLLFDIDNFKHINDHYGHQVGDEVIIQVANIIKKNIRNLDVASRWGGEEIAIYMTDVNQETAKVRAEHIVKEIQTLTFPEVTVSCGLSSWSKENKLCPKTLFNCADQGLYQAKRSGKNKVVTYNVQH